MMNKGLIRKIRKRSRIIEAAIIKNSTGVTKVKCNGKYYKINAAKYVMAMMGVRSLQWASKKVSLLRLGYDT